MLDLVDKTFKSTVLNTLNELKEIMHEELKETKNSILTNLNKNIEITERNQILEMKT